MVDGRFGLDFVGFEQRCQAGAQDRREAQASGAQAGRQAVDGEAFNREAFDIDARQIGGRWRGPLVGCAQAGGQAQHGEAFDREAHDRNALHWSSEASAQVDQPALDVTAAHDSAEWWRWRRHSAERR
jgi:hypothetical protein